MTPESAQYLAKAREQLAQAKIILSVNLPDAAGRAAYLAGFHAAQAYIFALGEKIVKTHSGVQSEFARLAKSEPRIDREMRAFLGRAYALKSIADYETGADVQISTTQAADAIGAAASFVACIAELIDGNHSVIP